MEPLTPPQSLALPWAGVALRVWHALQADAPTRAAIAEMLGLGAGGSAPPLSRGAGADAPGPSAEPPGTEPHHPLPPAVPDPWSQGPTAARAAQADAASDAAATPLLMTRLTQLRDASPAHERGIRPTRPPWVEQAAPFALQAAPQRPVSALWSRTRQRSLLCALLAREVPGDAPDIAALVQVLARGLPVTHLPRLPRRTLALGCELVLDAGSGMQPFAADLEQLERALRALLPADRLRVTHVADEPPSALTRRLGDGPASTVLAVTDFGLGARDLDEPAAEPARWVEQAGVLARQGRPLRALVPLPPVDWPAALAQSLALVHWAESTTLSGLRKRLRSGRPVRATSHAPDRATTAERRRARREASLALARVLAPARRIDRALLRSARRDWLPALPPRAEADFWWSGHVGTRGPSGLTLRESERAALLAALPDDTATATRAVPLAGAPAPALPSVLEWLAQSQHGQPASVRLEEALQALELLTPAGQPVDESAVQALLAAPMQALTGSDPDAERDVARWVPEAWARLSPALRASPTLQQFALAATLRLGHASWLPGRAAQADADTAAPWLLPDGGHEDWRVEWRRSPRGDVLRFARNAAPQVARHVLPLRTAAGAAWLGVGTSATLIDAAQNLSPAERVDWSLLRDGLELVLPPAMAVELHALDGARWQLLTDMQALARGLVELPGRGFIGAAIDDRHALLMGQPQELPESDAILLALPGSERTLTAVAIADAAALGVRVPGDHALWLVRAAAGALLPVPDGPLAGQPGPTAFVARGARDRVGAKVRRPETEISLRPASEGLSFLVALSGVGGRELGELPLAELRAAATRVLNEYRIGMVLCDRRQSSDGTQVFGRLHKELPAPDWRWFDAERPDVPADVLVAVGVVDPRLLPPQPPPLVLWSPPAGSERQALENWPPAWRIQVEQTQWLPPLPLQRTTREDHDRIAAAIVSALRKPRPSQAAPAAAPAAAASASWWSNPADAVRERVLRQLEESVQPGLHLVPLQGSEVLRTPLATLPAEAELLLLVHGEGGSLAATFGPLFQRQPALVAQLRARFGFALGFEYRSLTEGLLENAGALVEALPPGARLHVLGFSAGALLAELLCLSTDTREPWRAIESSVAGRRFAAAMRSRQPRVRHLVRVAAPMRGLSIGRTLGRAGSVTGSLLSVLFPFTPLGSGVRAAARLLEDPQVAPGWTDLHPDAPLIALLNARHEDGLPMTEKDSRLSVVAGTRSGSGLRAQLADLTLRLATGTSEHDLVVALRENFGGWQRPGGFDWRVFRGDGVTHFTLLERPESASAIVQALTEPRSDATGWATAATAAQALRALGLGEPGHQSDTATEDEAQTGDPADGEADETSGRAKTSRPTRAKKPVSKKA